MKSLRKEWQYIRSHPWDFVGAVVLASLILTGLWLLILITLRCGTPIICFK